MAKYSTDFGGYTADAQPSDWTLRYETVSGQVLTRTKAGTISGKVMRIEAHTNNAALIGATWDAIDADADRANFESVAILSVGEVVSTVPNVIGRASGTTRAAGTYAGGRYFTTSSTGKGIVKRVAGTPTTVASNTYTLAANTRLAIRVRMNGTTLSAKHWLYDTEAEPGTFGLSATVSDVSAAGWIGLVAGAISSSATKGPVDLEYFSVATNGETADLPGASPAGTVTITGVTPGVTSAAVTYSYSASDQTGFEYRINGGAAASIGASPATISGLTASTAYTVEVRAINAIGAGTWSAVSSFTTNASGDTTAPVLTTPTGAATGTTTASGGVTTDEASGTLYAVVTTSATPPSALDIREGTGAAYAASQAVTTTGAKSFSATGLTASTTYYWHYLHDDASANTSNIPTSAGFTTDAVPTVVKGISLVLNARATLTPRASVTGITARWWDSPTAAGAPLLKTDTASTDGTGLLTLNLDSVTTLAVASLGYLVLYKAGAGADTDLHFAGRVAISDIA